MLIPTDVSRDFNGYKDTSLFRISEFSKKTIAEFNVLRT